MLNCASARRNSTVPPGCTYLDQRDRRKPKQPIAIIRRSQGAINCTSRSRAEWATMDDGWAPGLGFAYTLEVARVKSSNRARARSAPWGSRFVSTRGSPEPGAHGSSRRSCHSRSATSSSFSSFCFGGTRRGPLACARPPVRRAIHVVIQDHPRRLERRKKGGARLERLRSLLQ